MADPLVPAPSELLVLSGQQCRDLMDLDELRNALGKALQAHSDGVTSVPPRIASLSGAGLLAAMPGTINGTGMAAKLVSVFEGNHGGSVPSHQGLIALFDENDGRPLAVLEGAYITAIRTASAAALATDLAARSNARTLAIIGAGIQGHAHATAFAGIRDWSEIRVASRTATHAEALAAATENASATSFEDAVRGADVVALCTSSPDPVMEHGWLSEGTHVSSVGIGHEVDPATMSAADRVLVEWRDAAANPPPAGAPDLQNLDPASLIEVGDIVAGRAIGRANDSELTVYKSTGHAVEDIAAARLVYDKALAAGVGTTVVI